MEFKGTKGEWSVNKDPHYYNGNKAYEVNYGIDGECLAEVVHALEDAKLISKAPELLELLNHFVEMSDELSVPDHLIETFANLYANAFNTIQEATTI